MTTRNQDRIHFIDYLRGFMVLLVVLDHSMHAYAPHFKKEWYIPNFGGELFFDIWHMHNDVIMMPMLFFLAGMFVLPSLNRRGFYSFAKEKFLRLVVPFIVGVAILVPPQTYFRSLFKERTTASYMDYWFNTFFWDEIWSSAFWFLLSLLILTIVLVIIQKLFPRLIKAMGCFARWVISHPTKGILALCTFAVMTIGVCEIAFGRYDFAMKTYFGILGKVMKVRQSRFLMEIAFFFMGAAMAQAGITQCKETLVKIGNAWRFWTVFSIVSGAAYITYSLTNFYDGAYSTEIMRYFYNDGTWTDAWPMIHAYGGPILIRTSLMGIFMIAVAGMHISLFQRFLDKPHPQWQNLAACSFGIYIFHETLIVPTHYYLLDSDISLYLKFLITAGLATTVSWTLTYILRPLPGFKRVL